MPLTDKKWENNQTGNHTIISIRYFQQVEVNYKKLLQNILWIDIRCQTYVRNLRASSKLETAACVLTVCLKCALPPICLRATLGSLGSCHVGIFLL